MNDVATGALADVPSGTWQIDPAHSVIGFSVRHLMSRVHEIDLRTSNFFDVDQHISLEVEAFLTDSKGEN